ncbi:MAG TPA: SGNH hydrolase domain-containing protein [Solirubrobacteraceae bacterium]|nr:SGNH hydrolase domain-containing protein [Solirubrobacteraceae bacterium]
MRRVVVGLIVTGLPVWSTTPVQTAWASHPACFGAAARDPVHRCINASLKLRVVPTPSEAQIMPNTPCTPIEAAINVCTFGTPAATAAGTIALIGDSHAWQWRGAVDVVARALNWQGLSSTRSSCPFTEGLTLLPEPKRAQCTEWNRGLLQWLTQHPEISTIFTSDHPGPVVTSRGQSLLAAQVAGVTAAWDALPATVKHVIVIRDIPYVHESTLACIERAIARHEDAGPACAVLRGEALHHDPDVVAAERLRSHRVQVVDLTHFFCDRRLCYPVVGGALVYRDADHLTSVFATTLGPFLLQQVDRLMASWR